MFGADDRLKREAQHQFIARPDDSKSLVIYKWPNNNIPFASIATVQPDEWAFFVRNGKIVGYLRAGMQRLDGASVPFVKDLIGEYTAERVLLGELYFVSRKQFANNKFGGSMGQLADPATGVMVGCGVYGQFAFQVIDPEKLVMGLVGTRPLPSNSEIVMTIRDRLLKTMRAIINSHVVVGGWDVLRVTSGAHNREFEDAVVKVVPEELAEIGLEVTAIQDFVVNVLPGDKPKLQEIYDRRAKMRLAEDQAYAEMASAELMLGAAEGLRSQGQAGAGDLAGLGIGVGVGMGLAHALVPPAATEQTPAVPAPAAQQARCASCDAALTPGARFCSQCATPVVAFAVICVSCGARVPAGSFCSACGSPLRGDV